MLQRYKSKQSLLLDHPDLDHCNNKTLDQYTEKSNSTSMISTIEICLLLYDCKYVCLGDSQLQ